MSIVKKIIGRMKIRSALFLTRLRKAEMRPWPVYFNKTLFIWPKLRKKVSQPVVAVYDSYLFTDNVY